VNDIGLDSPRFSLFAHRHERYTDYGRDRFAGGIDMSACCRLLFAASIISALIGWPAQADDYCPTYRARPVVVAMYVSPYACTEPAPPSLHPPIHIPNPFDCYGPNCPPTPGFGANPYSGGPIPLPPPPNAPPYPQGGAITPGGNPPGTHPGKRPIFDQSRTFGGVTQYIEPPQPKCKVSFWNQTGAELTLIVGDKTHRVAKDRAVVLALPREFTWKTDVALDKREQVPSDLNYFDVVIR
jgi:hypothetical protein